jgi:serine/threonine-protein kinase
MPASAAAAHDDRSLVLGRYRALRPLGSGGSGSVWLAYDEQARHEVALKVVPREGKAGARAEREAEAVERLRHPHCARVFSVDRDERHVYVAYEYVPGCTLREAIRSGRLDDRSTVEAGAQMLEALAHAHGRGIIHRDVKPANVLLAESGRGVDVRLLDFGLALMEDADTLTATGDVPGTLSYISPERLDGEEATGAADVWAVGVILWEAFAGQQPFFSASPVDTAKLIAAGAPSLARLRPDLPRPLVEAVDAALALDPEDRPAAARLAQMLRGAVAEQARRREHRPAVSRTSLLHRATPAAFAAGFAALAATLLPFYPHGGPAVLAAVVALAALAEPRAGLALALAVPVLPLGNVALGLAAVYVPLAILWLGLFWNDSRHGLLFLAGPLLSLAGGLMLLPLAAARAAGGWRRALVAGAGVVAAGLVAGLRGAALPLDGARPPRGLGIAGSDQPLAVASTLVGALADHRVLAVEAVVLAVATVTLPLVRRHGPLGIAVWGTTLLPLALLAPPLLGGGRPDALPVVGGTLLLCALLGLPHLRTRSGR